MGQEVYPKNIPPLYICIPSIEQYVQTIQFHPLILYTLCCTSLSTRAPFPFCLPFFLFYKYGYDCSLVASPAPNLFFYNSFGLAWIMTVVLLSLVTAVKFLNHSWPRSYEQKTSNVNTAAQTMWKRSINSYQRQKHEDHGPCHAPGLGTHKMTLQHKCVKGFAIKRGDFNGPYLLCGGCVPWPGVKKTHAHKQCRVSSPLDFVLEQEQLHGGKEKTRAENEKLGGPILLSDGKLKKRKKVGSLRVEDFGVSTYRLRTANRV